MPEQQGHDNSLEQQYQNLWDNMQQTNSHNFTVIVGIIAASGAILTAAFATINKNPNERIDPAIIGGIFISIYVITVPGLLLLNSNRHLIWELSTYIRVFLEPELKGLKWETNLAKRREMEKRKLQKTELFTDVIGNEYLITVVINFTATVAASFSFYYSSNLSASFKFLLIIVAVACWICFSWFFGLRMKSLKRGQEIEEAYCTAWTDTKKEP